MKPLNQLAAIFGAEVRAFIREAGILIFLAAFPFMLSGLTYGAGSLLAGGKAASDQWFYQLIGFSVMTISIVMTSSSAWYFRRGMMTGRLEYAMAAPVNPLVVVLASALSNVILGLINFIIVGAVGVTLIYGIAHLLNLLTAIIILFIALLPVVGVNLVVGILTIIAKEPEPLTNAINAVISATSGFVYPITLLPSFLQLIGKALPHSYAVEISRATVVGNLQLTQLTSIIFLTAYLAAGLVVYRVGENYFARKVGVHGW